ncbi:hypothetical protein DFH09DRAFT_1047145 [Mycena vulgaris]|nr:hypothetical protein DFH09DRAFT_1047145 [Mycena vulgaris]
MSARPRRLPSASHPEDRSPSTPPRPRGRRVPDQRADSLGGEARDGDPLDCLNTEQPRSIHGGTFISSENIHHRHEETGIQSLHRAVALEALYDSAESFPQPRCDPETRTKMLDDLYNWAIADNSAYSIRWLHGPTGAGKSAVMQSLCERLQDSGRLGGSFFFKRGHTTRGNAKVLFATLAYQLALSNQNLNPLIPRIVKDNPSVTARSMDVQLRKLIVEPCQSLNGGASPILLIDGLDKCEENNVQQEILRLLGGIAAHHHPLRLRLLIASRPESHIREKFDSIRGLYHSIQLDQSFMDVENYLRNEFNRIHHEHHETMASVPFPWPSRDIMERLVDKSSGYFIYAATIIKFVDDRDFRPTQRLAAVVENLPTECGNNPHQTFDKKLVTFLGL